MVSRMRIKTVPALAVLAAVAVSGCETVPVSPSRGASTANDSVQEAVSVQELRREVAELRDTVEVQRNELDKLRERQRQLYDDLDYRLRRTEQGSGGQGVGQSGGTGGQQLGYGQSQQGYGQSSGQDSSQSAGAASGQSTGQAQSGSSQQSQASSSQTSSAQGSQPQEQVYGQQGVSQGENQGENQGQGSGAAGQSQQTASMQPPPAATPGQQGSGQMAVASTEEQSAYDDAFELLKQSRYADAIIEFRSLISRFPNGALIDDAQYWIGEAYYVTRDFDSALDAFRAVVNQYPDSQRVPEAMLKLGYVQAELGQNEEARQTLNQVISQYPGSRVAISAETRLNKIR